VATSKTPAEEAQEQGLKKLSASALLLEQGRADGTVGIVECLKSSDGALCQAALRRLLSFTWNRDLGGYQVPLDREAVFLAVEPLVHSFDGKTRINAARVLRRLETDAARTRLLQILGHADPALRLEAATWLAARGEDEGALDVIESCLAASEVAPNDAYYLFMALANLGERGAPEVKVRVASIAMGLARHRMQVTDSWTDVWQCLKAVRAAAPPGEAVFLSEVLKSNLSGRDRGAALIRLAELEGEPGVDRLCKALQDAILRNSAAEGLATLARGANSARAREVLIVALTTESDASMRTGLVKALLSISDGKDLEGFSQHLQQPDPFVEMSVHWVISNTGPSRVAERLAQAGIIATVPAEELKKYENSWTKERNAMGIVSGIFHAAGKLWAIDRRSTFAADYVAFISKLGGLCHGVVAITDASQVRDSGGEDQYRVRFVAGAQAFSFLIKNHGRWYDMDTVLSGVNSALETLGVRERFIQLRITDQFSVGVFAQPELFLPIAEDLRIPLQPVG
jgi:HEAT repeat protein